MTKAAALYQFFNTAIPVTLKDFGLTEETFGKLSVEEQEEIWNGGYMRFYTSTSVPDDVVFPYGTYEYITSAWEGGEVGITVNLWFHTTLESVPNAKAEELSAVIGLGGKVIECDGGGIWLKRGSPWCQSLTDDTDEKIKRRYINVSAEYFTPN